MEETHGKTRRDGITRYEVTGNPHPIQARKAWEDNDTWMAGTLLAFEDGVATVAFGDGEEPAPVTGLRIGGPVWVTERWGVLAFADEDGNAVAIRPLDELGDSIFTRIGAVRLRFVSVRPAEEPAESPDEEPDEEPVEFVYGIVTGLDGMERLNVLPRSVAEDTAQVVDIVNSCTTWGEVREMATADQCEEMLAMAGFDEDDRPANDDTFDPNEVDGIQSAQYPMTPEMAHELYLPSDIQSEYGVWERQMMEGPVLTIPVENGPAVVAELRRRGHRCTEDSHLLARELERFAWMGWA